MKTSILWSLVAALVAMVTVFVTGISVDIVSGFSELEWGTSFVVLVFNFILFTLLFLFVAFALKTILFTAVSIALEENEDKVLKFLQSHLETFLQTFEKISYLYAQHEELAQRRKAQAESAKRMFENLFNNIFEEDKEENPEEHGKGEEIYTVGDNLKGSEGIVEEEKVKSKVKEPKGKP